MYMLLIYYILYIYIQSKYIQLILKIYKVKQKNIPTCEPWKRQTSGPCLPASRGTIHLLAGPRRAWAPASLTTAARGPFSLSLAWWEPTASFPSVRWVGGSGPALSAAYARKGENKLMKLVPLFLSGSEINIKCVLFSYRVLVMSST